MKPLNVKLINMQEFLKSKISLYFHESGNPKNEQLFDLDFNWQDIFGDKTPHIEFNKLRVDDFPGMDKNFFDTHFEKHLREGTRLYLLINSLLYSPPSNSGIKNCSYTETSLIIFERDFIGPYFSTEFCSEWNKKTHVQYRILKGQKIPWFAKELEKAFNKFKEAGENITDPSDKEEYQYISEDISEILSLVKEGLEQGYSDYLIIEGATYHDVLFFN